MIVTDRLIIRPIEEKDYKDLCEYGVDEETGKYMLYWPKNKEQIRTFILKAIEANRIDNPTRLEFVIELKSIDKVIGHISLLIKDRIGDIGWLSNKHYWNNGYMSEAVKAFIDYSFKYLPIHHIIATCTDQNIATYKVMEKCGMIKVSENKNQKAIKDGEEVSYTKLVYCIKPE